MGNLWKSFSKKEDKRKEISDNSTLVLFVCLGIFGSAMNDKDRRTQPRLKGGGHPGPKA